MKADNILQTIGNTPHVRINKLCRSDIEVWMKIERFNPGSSIKDRIAVNMVDDAEKSGLLKPGGVIIFHDIQARMMDFGAWKFWEEIAPQHNSFTFKQGFGLGVLRKAGGEPSTNPLLKILFEGDTESHEALRAFYAHASKFHEMKLDKCS